MSNRSSVLAWCSAMALLGAFVTTSAAQQSPGAEPAEVIILGTYHFANPGLDVVKIEVADVLSPEKQNEIREVVEALARFRPTKIAVEALPASAPPLDSLYRAYRAGQHTLSRNEVQQLGFRVAERFGHSRVYPVDQEGEFPFGAVMEYAQQQDPAFVERVQRTLAEITAEQNRLQKERTVGEILRLKNEPERIAWAHSHYVDMARVGAGDTYVGADLLSKWYERNIRIFSNLQRLAEPGDRILVICGAGHAAILRELVASDSRLELVDAREYLPPPA
jgi:hypothetical protein